MKRICVYCGSSTQLDPVFHDVAESVGRSIAQRGLTLVYGGGRIGLMGEVARAAAEAGATVVGVMTHKLVGHEQANEDCDELIVVDTMQERRRIMADRGDAFLVLPGGIGTYEEFFEVLVGRQLNDHTKPIGIVNVADYFEALVRLIEHGIEHRFVRPALRDVLHVHACPDAVIDHLIDGDHHQPSHLDILPMHQSKDGGYCNHATE